MFSASERWKSSGSCGTSASCERKDTCAAASNLLPVDQDAALIQVVEPLQQLDEGRLAGARVAHQAHAFARLDAQA